MAGKMCCEHNTDRMLLHATWLMGSINDYMAKGLVLFGVLVIVALFSANGSFLTLNIILWK